MTTPQQRFQTEALARFFRPSSVAIVGASERQQRSNNAVQAMRERGVPLYFVNNSRPEVYGEKAYADLAAIGKPVDAVLSIVPASAAIDVVADAERIGAGGVVVIAGGFAESGGDGVQLQERLRVAGAGMPVLGPNCNGYIRPDVGARLSGAPILPFPDGSVGVVTHSGALLGVFGLSAVERVIGYSSLISTGNEMTLDMADCVEFLADDDATRCIALVVETVRSPARFFAAVDRAIARGKPVVALKLGRSARGRQVATSHTGALAGEAWMYDAAFRQHGVGIASDLVDLLDRVALLAQLPPERWSPVRGLAGLSLSGGWGAMAGDICAEEKLVLPELAELAPRINEHLPERSIVNPLDLTGFAMGKAQVVENVLDILASSDEVDALLVHGFLDEAGFAISEAFVEAAVATAESSGLPVVLGSVEDGHPGDWTHGLAERGIAVGRGLRSTIRGLATMGEHVRFAARPRVVPQPAAPVARPQVPPVPTEAGPMLGFAEVMALLASAGIPVAPYALVGADDDVATPAFPGPYVAKLADVPHRSDIGALRLGVTAAGLAQAVSELRAVAAAHETAATVAIQQQLEVFGEAFVGIQARSDLGPLILFGVGGIFVELLGRVSGRFAPMSEADVDDLLGELEDTGVFTGARGQRPWPRTELAQILHGLSRLALGSAAWMESLDVNPLALTERGFIALDGLCLLQP